MLCPDFTPFPELTTARLHLRQLRLEDDHDVLALYGSPDIMRYIPLPLAKNLADAQFFINKINNKLKNNEGINWAITLTNDPNKVIGIIGYVRIAPEHYRAEVGYMLHTDYHNQRIMDEALTRVIQYGFESLSLHSIEAIVNPKNIASKKLLLKKGFIKEAHFRENEWFNGQFIDNIVYSLWAGGKPKSRAARTIAKK